ncbi:MAG TPA: molybdopterin cofactor-binding domain-containing protein [Alphaproteobacteria bacterium]|nr:molybdopterin cofactor-binding domain-containing protein [Alphaproteobacteria bacterium]
MNDASIRAVGANLPRLEARGKLTGRAEYTDDLVRPGMLHGAVLGSPYAHARILSYDTAAALAVPGVKAVITGADYPDLPMGCMIKDERLLAKEKVRYVGQPVAAVAAIDLATARKAIRLIEVEYEALAEVATIDDALAPDAPIIHEGLAEYFKIFEAECSGNVLSHQVLSEGDVEAAWPQCDHIVEETYETQPQSHAYMEPCAALAEVDDTGKVSIWSSHQSINRVQANVAEALGLPMSKVRALTPRVGGAFGGKMEATVQPLAAALALKTNRPVKIVLSREDDFQMIRSRHGTQIRIKTGCKSDGTILAREAELFFDAGAYADDSAGVMGFALLMARGPYNIPNVRCEGHCVYTNKLRAAGFRGFGNPQVTFAGESQMDELADVLGMDPIELRLKNAMRNGDKQFGGHTVEVCGLVECLEKVRDQSGWAAKRQPAKANGVTSGIGISCLSHVCGLLSTGAIVRLAEDGSLVLSTGAVDNGQGSDTALAQICAEALQVDVAQVNFVAPDTDTSPYNWGTGASRVTYMVGRAVHDAALEVREKILKAASMMLEADQGDLELAPGGKVQVKGTDISVGFFDVSMFSLFGVGGPILGQSTFLYDGEPFDPKRTTMQGFPFANLGVYLFGAQAVAVEVDEITGKTEVKEAWLAHDVGKAINPAAVEGQIQGGFVQGVGYALFEEMVWDGGQLVNPSFMDYKIPGAHDVPYEIHPIIVENPEPTGPFGARGIGEPGLVGVAPAVANAVHNATGIRFHSLPLTPEKVLTAMLSEATGDSSTRSVGAAVVPASATASALPAASNDAATPTAKATPVAGSSDAPDSNRPTGASTEISPFARVFVEGLKDAGVSIVAALPESLLASIYRACEQDDQIRYIPVTNEAELPGIVAGAYLAGKKAVMIMENSGLRQALEPIARYAYCHAMPMVMVMCYRGDLGEENWWGHNHAQTMEPILDAIRIPWRTVRKIEDIMPSIKKAIKHADSSQWPVALVLSGECVEIPNYGKD